MKRPALPDREARQAARSARMRALMESAQMAKAAPVRQRPVAPSTGLVDAALAGFDVPEVVPAPKATAAEKRHMARVAALRCVLCERLQLDPIGKVDVHHLREGQGMAQRASNWLVAALCHERCHQGTRGVHGDRSLLKQAKCTELDLLAWTLEALAREDACAKR